jgi:hypothetical protein
MRKDSADAFVTAVQDAFLGRGFYLFRTGERATSGLETDALALYPTRDPYVVMRAMETNASNYGMSTEDVIAWFRKEEARYPIQFMVIGFDYAGGHLGGLVPDETEFARRFIRFCPDIQSEGSISAKRLGRDFKGIARDLLLVGLRERESGIGNLESLQVACSGATSTPTKRHSHAEARVAEEYWLLLCGLCGLGVQCLFQRPELTRVPAVPVLT